MTTAALLMENILKQTFPVAHYETLQLLSVNYQAAEKCQYWGSVQECWLSLNLGWLKNPSVNLQYYSWRKNIFHILKPQFL